LWKTKNLLIDFLGGVATPILVPLAVGSVGVITVSGGVVINSGVAISNTWDEMMQFNRANNNSGGYTPPPGGGGVSNTVQVGNNRVTFGHGGRRPFPAGTDIQTVERAIALHPES